MPPRREEALLLTQPRADPLRSWTGVAGATARSGRESERCQQPDRGGKEEAGEFMMGSKQMLPGLLAKLNRQARRLHNRCHDQEAYTVADHPCT